MDAAKHATTHKTLPITKIYLDQNINNAEVENPALPVAFFLIYANECLGKRVPYLSVQKNS